MGTVVSFKEPFVTAVQLSKYQQEDGSDLYVIEALNADDTWDILSTAENKADGWMLAGKAAADLGVSLLPVSTFPGRAA